MKVIVSGAGGFVGSAVSDRFDRAGAEVVGLVRTPRARSGRDHHLSRVADVLDYPRVLEGESADVFIHLAGVTGRSGGVADESELYRVNVAGTSAALRAARNLGVKHFVHMSSVGVHGRGGVALVDATSPILPYDGYTRSKALSEEIVAKFSGDFDATTILRPPAIYGPGGKGKFDSLLRLVKKGLGGPLTMFDQNRRSVIAVELLTDIVERLSQRASGYVECVVSNGDAVSTADIVRSMASGSGVPQRWPKVPLADVVLRSDKILAGGSITGSFEIEASWQKQLDPSFAIASCASIAQYAAKAAIQ